MTSPRPTGSSWPFVAALLAALGAAGCGSKGLVPVEGRVTFAGATPPARGHLFFVPREMSVDRKRDREGSLPGTALCAADGTFKASTFAEGDGLRPGTYEVRLECAAGPPAAKLDVSTHDAPVKTAVPSGFAPPDLVVPPSGPRPVRYDLDVR